MNFYFKRILLSLQRQIGKTTAVFATMFILFSLIAFSYTISQAVTLTYRNFHNRFPPLVSITTEGWISGLEIPDEPLSHNLLRQIGALPQVKQYDFILDFNDVSSHYLFPWYNGREGSYLNWINPSGHRLTIRGVENPNLFDEQLGIISVISGRQFTDEEMNASSSNIPVIISYNFAQVNQLAVGSIIEIENNVWPYRQIENNIIRDESGAPFANQTYLMEIIGIFELRNGVIDIASFGEQEEWLLNNRIYMPNSWVEKMGFFSLYHNQAAWNELVGESHEVQSNDILRLQGNVDVLRDRGYMEGFKSEARSLLPDGYEIVDLSTMSPQVNLALDNMVQFSNWILYSTLVATFLMMILLVLLILRERKYELGLYLAMGEKPKRIFWQLFAEIMIIATASSGLAFVAGHFLAELLSSQLLEMTLANSQSGAFSHSFNPLISLGYAIPFEMSEISEVFTITFQPRVMLRFFMGGLLILSLSLILPFLYTLRLSPKKMLLP